MQLLSKVPSIPQKLVLPKTVIERIKCDMERDIRAKLGPNEIQIFDIKQKSHAAWAWHFTDGNVFTPSGMLGMPLTILAPMIRDARSGCAFLDFAENTKDIYVFPLELGADYSVRDSKVVLGNKKKSFVEAVHEFFKISDWEPHGVIGGRVVLIKDSYCDFGRCACIASSRHVAHPEFAVQNLPGAFIINYLLNYYLPSIPSIDILLSGIDFEININPHMEIRNVYLIGCLKNGAIEIAAWSFTKLLDKVLIEKLARQMMTDAIARFGQSTSIFSMPPEIIDFRINRWLELFPQHVEDKMMVKIPIVDENGTEIKMLKYNSS